MVRLNQAADSSDQLLPQLRSLHKVLRLVVRVHSFKRVLICVRISPKSDAIEKDALQSSLVRQQTFLQHCVEDCGVPVDVLIANQVSAYSDAFIDMLLDRLAELGSGVLVVSAATDRITRSDDQYARLRAAATDGDHGVLSFLWDSETELPATTALRLPNGQAQTSELLQWQASLDLQRRAPQVPLTIPMVQPIIWIYASTACSTIEDHVGRHVQNAVEWVQAGRLSSYQGHAGPVPDQLMKDDSGRGFHADRMKQWEAYIAK